MKLRLPLLVGVLVLVSGTAVALKLANRSSDDDEVLSNPLRKQAKINPALFAEFTVEPTFGKGQPLVSQLCTQSQFESEALKRWLRELQEEPRFHSKQWEYAYILQALSEREMMQPGRKGLGFGVGQEQLPAVFAKHGVDVLATDLDVEHATKLGWVDGNQHMSNIEVLNKRGIATEEQFRRHVKVMNVDMNNIPGELHGYDFIWSTCSLGHLGNLEKGLQFIDNSLKTLKPGGVAVHTTEFNLTSDKDTYETENTSVYRKHDIIQLVERLSAQGHEIKVNLNHGKGPLDSYVDEQFGTEDKHLRLRLGRYAVTSLGLVIRKSPQAR